MDNDEQSILLKGYLVFYGQGMPDTWIVRENNWKISVTNAMVDQSMFTIKHLKGDDT